MGLSAYTMEQPELEKTVLNQYLETTNLGVGVRISPGAPKAK